MVHAQINKKIRKYILGKWQWSTDHFQQNPDKHTAKRNRRRSKSKMAEGMGRGNEGCNNKRVRSRSEEKAKIKNSNKPSILSKGNGPQENEGLYPLL